MQFHKSSFSFAAILFSAVLIAAPVRAQTAGEIAFWETVSKNGSPEMIRAYLKKYPDGHFVDLAEIMLGDSGTRPEMRPKSTIQSQPSKPKIVQRGVTECDQLATYPDDPDAVAPGVRWVTLKKQSERAVRACLQAVERKNDGRANYQLYRAYLANGQPSFGKDYLTRSVRKGYPIARYWQAENYAKGDAGFPKDRAKGVRLHEQNAARGHDGSAYRAGYYLTIGKEIPADYTKALRLLRQAERAGNKNVYFSLGWLHQTGKGVPKNAEIAKSYYRKSIEGGRFGSNDSKTRLARIMLAEVEKKQRYNTRPVGLTQYREALSLLKSARNKNVSTHNEYIRTLAQGVEKAHYRIAQAQAARKRLSNANLGEYQSFISSTEHDLKQALKRRSRIFPSRYAAKSNSSIDKKVAAFNKTGTRTERRLRTALNFGSWYTRNKPKIEKSGGAAKHCLRSSVKTGRDNTRVTLSNRCSHPLTASLWLNVTSEGRRKHRSTKTLIVPANGSKKRTVYYKRTNRAIRSRTKLRACFVQHGAPYDIKNEKYKCKSSGRTFRLTSKELSKMSNDLKSVRRQLVDWRF